MDIRRRKNILHGRTDGRIKGKEALKAVICQLEKEVGGLDPILAMPGFWYNIARPNQHFDTECFPKILILE